MCVFCRPCLIQGIALLLVPDYLSFADGASQTVPRDSTVWQKNKTEKKGSYLGLGDLVEHFPICTYIGPGIHTSHVSRHS